LKTAFLAGFAIAIAIAASPAAASELCPASLIKSFADFKHTSFEYEMAECRHSVDQTGLDAAGREIQQNKLDDMENRLRALEEKDQ
jgi:hypothetical protein